MSTLVEDLKSAALDEILSIREQLGADLAQVRLVTRTWSGDQIGEGTFTDTVAEMHPAPGVKDLSHSYRVAEGGAFQQGDLLLTMISKHKYPTEADINGVSSSATVEKFYEVNGALYRVISVVSKYVYWDVQVRKVTGQRPVVE